MPSMHRQILAFLRVQRLEVRRHLQLAVAALQVQGAVRAAMHRHLGSVPTQFAQRLRNSCLQLRLRHVGQGV